jgi:outer membrane protein
MAIILRARPCLWLWALLCPLAGAQISPFSSAGPTQLDYSRGPSAFPKIWSPYRQAAMPRPNLSNTPRLAESIHDGKLALSVSEFLRLVIANSLDITGSRYLYLIAETDILRAKSGQAARGVPQVSIPSGLFAGAIGAGIASTTSVNAGGTGATAITGAAKQVVVGPRGGFDPTISVNMSYDRVISPLNTTRVAGTLSVTVPSAVLQTRYQQQLSTGTGFSVSFNMQRQSSSQNFLLFDPAYTSLLSFAIYQPLLNGFGSAFNRRFITVTRNNREISREVFHQQLTQSLADAENLYWDYVALREAVRVAQQAVVLAEKLYGDNQKQLALGALAPLDVVQAESQLASSRRDLVFAQTNLQMQELRVKSALSKNITPELAAAQLEPTDSLPEPLDTPIPPLEQAVTSALRDRALLHQARIGLENQKISEQFTSANLKPTFSIFGVANAFALAAGAGPMARQIGRWVYPEYAVGFSLTVPLLNRSAQADNIRSRVEFNQARSSLQRSENQVGVQVRTALVSLIQGKAQVEASRRAIEGSQEALRAEEVRLQLGSSIPYRVILAQRDLASAQFAEVQAEVNFAKALVALHLAMGNTLQSHNISFEDVLHARLQ